MDSTQPVLGGMQLGQDNLGQGCWKRDSSFGHGEGVGGEQMTSAVPSSPELSGREKQPQNSERHTRLLRTEQRSQYSWREEGGSGRGESRSPEQMRWGTKLTRLERAELRDSFLKTVS